MKRSLLFIVILSSFFCVIIYRDIFIKALRTGSFNPTKKEIDERLSLFKNEIQYNFYEIIIVFVTEKKQCLVKIRDKKILKEFKRIILNNTKNDEEGIAKFTVAYYVTLLSKNNKFSFKINSHSKSLMIKEDNAFIEFYDKSNFNVEKEFLKKLSYNSHFGGELDYKYGNSKFLGQFKNIKLREFLSKYILQVNKFYKKCWSSN